MDFNCYSFFAGWPAEQKDALSLNRGVVWLLIFYAYLIGFAACYNKILAIKNRLFAWAAKVFYNLSSKIVKKITKKTLTYWHIDAKIKLALYWIIVFMGIFLEILLVSIITISYFWSNWQVFLRCFIKIFTKTTYSTNTI